MLGLSCSMRTLSCSRWNPVPPSGIATRSLPQGRGVLATAPQGKPPARSYTGSLLSVQLPGVLRVSSLFSHLHTCASAILPLLPETHGPLSGGWSRRLSQEWKTSFWDTAQWSGPHPRVHRVEAERDPIDPAPDIVTLLAAWAGEVWDSLHFSVPIGHPLTAPETWLQGTCLPPAFSDLHPTYFPLSSSLQASVPSTVSQGSKYLPLRVYVKVRALALSPVQAISDQGTVWTDGRVLGRVESTHQIILVVIIGPLNFLRSSSLPVKQIPLDSTSKLQASTMAFPQFQPILAFLACLRQPSWKWPVRPPWVPALSLGKFTDTGPRGQGRNWGEHSTCEFQNSAVINGTFGGLQKVPWGQGRKRARQVAEINQEK